MDLPVINHESASPDDPQGSRGHTRRSFIRRVAGGLAIAVPAFRVLAGAGSASAANPCAKTHDTYTGHYCSNTGTNGCNFNVHTGSCIGEYTVYSATQTGYVCGYYTDVECEVCCHNS